VNSRVISNGGGECIDSTNSDFVADGHRRPMATS